LSEEKKESSRLAFQLKVEAVILAQNESIGRDHGTDIIFGHDSGSDDYHTKPATDSRSPPISAAYTRAWCDTVP
jgi:hypothetical protein